ncbi:MAG: hypothetical protein J2P31_06090 [Blastocatellia bacterium]|nr:hypothetical protein [Blastocatellia bacterium]
MERTQNDHHNDQRIIQYLLNELPEEDQVRFEDEYLEDDALFEQVRAVEEELIEDYVRGRLTERVRRLFERHYLASEQRRARLESARQLILICTSESESSLKAAAGGRIGSRIRGPLFSFARPRLVLGFGVVAALFLIVASGLVFELMRLRGQLSRANAERAALERQAGESERRLADQREQLAMERRENSDLRQKVDSGKNRTVPVVRQPLPVRTAEDQTVHLTLAPDSRDLNEPNKAVLSAETKYLELRVSLEKQDKSPSYRAAVKTVDGNREIWNKKGIVLQKNRTSNFIVIVVPADLFREMQAQDYMLTVVPLGGRKSKSYEDIESYYFHVVVK